MRPLVLTLLSSTVAAFILVLVRETNLTPDLRVKDSGSCGGAPAAPSEKLEIRAFAASHRCRFSAGGRTQNFRYRALFHTGS